jgi:proline iminopeptidase
MKNAASAVGILAVRGEEDVKAIRKLNRIWEGNQFATPYLLPEVVGLDLTAINKLAVPLILFEGRHDRNVNSELASAWFDTVKAPEKQLVWRTCR